VFAQTTSQSTNLCTASAQRYIVIVNSENTAVNRPSGAAVEQTFVSNVVVTVLFPGAVPLV